MKRLKKRYRSLICLASLFICKAGFAQIGSIPKFNHLNRKNITVFVFDSPCPQFINTKEKYGFSIKCVEHVTRKLKRQQQKAIRLINHTYGINWFTNHYEAFKKLNS